jgi:glutamyl-tRNA synthetase
MEPKAAKLLSDEARALLGELAPSLETLAVWSAGELEAAVRQFAQTRELGLGKVAQPLRAALSGRTVSPPVFDVLAIFGRDESLARIKDAIG